MLDVACEAIGMGLSTGGWVGSDLQAEAKRWRLPIPEHVADELVRTSERFRLDGVRPSVVAARPGGLEAVDVFLAEVRERLYDGPGFAVLTGFPVDCEPEAIELAYWTLGLLFGRPVSQNRKGDLLGRVENRGADIGDPTRRGHESDAALPFHCDRADVVGLLCVRRASSGGRSMLASSKALYATLRAERPELVAELTRPLPEDRRGEEPPGEPPWLPIPIFAETTASFAARYVRRFVEGSQRHDSAPRLTDAQVAAMDALDEILGRPGFALAMDLEPGEIQIVNNAHLLHARTAFDDGAAPEGRLLLRLWLAVEESPELPPHYAPLYGATAAGAYRGGVWPADGAPRFIGTRISDLEASL
jgi:hypothetical protein